MAPTSNPPDYDIGIKDDGNLADYGNRAWSDRWLLGFPHPILV